MASPWSVDYCPAGIVHWHRSHESQVRTLVIEIEPSRLESLGNGSKYLQAPASLQGQRCRWLLSNLYRAFHEADALSDMEAEGFLLVLLSEVIGAKTLEARVPPWLRQAYELVRERFKEPLGLSEIAQSVGLHPVWLASNYHRFYRRTVGQMIRRLRVEYASRQLTESDQSLADIALNAGFSDQSHFANIFRRATGMTPRQYRLTGRVSKT